MHPKIHVWGTRRTVGIVLGWAGDNEASCSAGDLRAIGPDIVENALAGDRAFTRNEGAQRPCRASLNRFSRAGERSRAMKKEHRRDGTFEH